MSEPSHQARYSVGIDLGTTHCVLSYIDLEANADKSGKDVDVNVLAIPQLVQPGVIGREASTAFINLPRP